MPHGLITGQGNTQTFVDDLVTQGVVQKVTATGETLFELYSLLEYLEPEVDDLAACLKQVRLVPTREDVLGLYLMYIPLADVLTYLVPVCHGRRR